MYEILDDIFQEVLVAIALGTGVYVIAWFRKRGDRISQFEKKLQKQKESIRRLTKTLIIFAKLIDTQTEKAHEDVTSQLEEIAEEMLLDD